MRQPRSLFALLVFGYVQHASPAVAQTGGEAAPGRIEVAAGPWWIGATSVGSRDATLTAADGSRFRLFSTSSELASASGAEVRVGARLARVLDAEVAASYMVPQLTTGITADTENGAPTTGFEAIKQITIEGAAVIYLPRRLGPHLVPFVTGGGGYLRQIHERQTFIQTGRVYHVGGGIKVPLVSRAAARTWVKQIGVRVDARALIRTAGVTLDDRAHVAPALGASLFARF
jgi:hypothetical protein